MISVVLGAARENSMDSPVSFAMEPQADGTVILSGTENVARSVINHMIGEDDEEPACQYCHGTPCFWTQKQDEINFYMEILFEDEDLTNKEKRYKAYRFISSLYEGYLGRDVRKQLPQCLEGEIKDMFPKGPNDDDYVGFVPGKKSG